MLQKPALHFFRIRPARQAFQQRESLTVGSTEAASCLFRAVEFMKG